MSNFNVGNLIYKITGDSSSLDKSLKTSNTKMSGFSKTISNVSKVLKATFITGAVAVAAKKIFDLGSAFISAASDAEETGNKFNVVFASVADDAEDAASRIKKEFKLSDETVEDFLSGVGDITSGLGATSEEALNAAEKITTLGLDINSFANLSGGAEQAVKALTSLFTGEREAAKALGIVINDTNLKAYAEDMGKVYAELTPLEKGFLSLELATSQSQLAIGDFARSADSYANTAKASAEATKDFKAALGESLLPAATESLRIFTGLTNILTEFIKKRNEINAAEKAAESGLATQKQKILLIEDEITALESTLEFYKKQSDSNRIAGETVKDLKDKTIDLITNLLREKDAIIQISKAQQEAADKQKIIDDENAKVELTRLAAEDLLAGRVKSRLTDEEKQLEYLSEQIDYWVQFREVTGVQALLNDLIAERNELLNTEGDILNESAETKFTNYEYEKAQIEGLEYAHRKFTDGVIEGNEEQAISYADLASIGIGSMVAGFDALGQSLVEGSLSAADFGRLMLTSIASTLTALGSQLAAMATVQLLLGNVAGAAVGYAESAGAFLASGVVTGLAGSFENGGIIPGTSTTGDNLTANVNSGEMVLNKKQQASLFNIANSGGSSGGTSNYYLIVDGNPLKATIQSWINNKQLRGKDGAL